jgi:hypothetical protein
MVYPSAAVMSLVKHLFTIAIASGPETRTTAKADTPAGVAGAVMVSCRFCMFTIETYTKSYLFDEITTLDNEVLLYERRCMNGVRRVILLFDSLVMLTEAVVLLIK